MEKSGKTFWLVKTEPNVFSWDDLIKAPAIWDGVRNYAARNHLKQMQKGDLVFVYHSNIGREIVGLAVVTKQFFQDPTTNDERWVAIELTAKKKFKKPLPLDIIKKTKGLQQMKLVTIGRLSVMPVTNEEAEIILKSMLE